jgi:hypothetical protein
VLSSSSSLPLLEGGTTAKGFLLSPQPFLFLPVRLLRLPPSSELFLPLQAVVLVRRHIIVIVAVKVIVKHGKYLSLRVYGM